MGKWTTLPYAVSTTDTSLANKIEQEGQELNRLLDQYAENLVKITSFDRPKGIIFHDVPSATQLFSDIPLPAYTSKSLIHMAPTIAVWKDIFLSTLEGLDLPEVSAVYESYGYQDIAVIAAHELTHHADCFLDDFDNESPSSLWFEEGMCFYLPRKLMLSASRFQQVLAVEKALVAAYKHTFGEYSLQHFGQSGYRAGNSRRYEAAFYDYWRSMIAVTTLIENYCKGDISTLLTHYQQWGKGETTLSLQSYFVKYLKLSKEEAAAIWLSE